MGIYGLYHDAARRVAPPIAAFSHAQRHKKRGLRYMRRPRLKG